ncbi:MAG: FAD-dependent oxidoreductase [Rhodospirillaceae bacterium]|nr:FAD-dependent oxidoreductase [Rhodospirillaceae bacterium]
MTQPFPNLFTPLTLRHKTLKNRIVFGAHTTNMAEDGLPVGRHLGYYAERALGGAGMIVVEPVPVHATAVLTRGNFRPSDDAVIPGFRAITDACHAHGTVMIHQLYHVGQHGDFDNSYMPNFSPSGLPSYHDYDGSHAMTEAEIEDVIDGFVQAARRAFEADFDGIELFAAYHALIDQFWLPWSNRRDDKWGGTFENRMRFSTEIIRRIRSTVGEDFIIGMAVSVDPTSEAALSIESMQEIIAYHDENHLIDYVTCGTGSYFDTSCLIPSFLFPDKLGAPFAEALRSVVKHALVQAESHIRTPENADYVVASGQADMVSIVRGQIADPHLANKAKDGRDDDIRGCISCNHMCWGRRSRDYWISCLVNPSAGREFEWGGDRFTATETPKKVLVVGGGPAGLEAARVAAERGHTVTLVEAASDLGGQFRLAGLQPRRSQISELIEWYERQLIKLGVDIRLNAPLDGDEVKSFGADAVVMATGSLPAASGFQRALPLMETLPGIDQPNVFSVEDVMARTGRPGKRVLVLDDTGNWRAAGTAMHLAEKDHQVTIITAAPMVGFDLTRTSADGPLRERLKKLGCHWFCESAVTEWHGDGATVRDLLTGIERRMDADALVLATTNVAETWLAGELAESGLEIHSVGDCVAPRSAVMAIYEGRVMGMKV